MSMLHPRLVSDEPAARVAVSPQRIFDVCVASIALVLLSPVMLLIAVAVWLETGRPIFFAQNRIGQHGRPFLMYKFRKFGAACGVSGSPLTRPNDDRLTSVGRILALTKADELPQFYNVLIGDMSIVGPRPESLAFEDCFQRGFDRLLEYRPGLFGPAQIMFRHEQRFIPPGVDLIEFYRTVLFPLKATIDLDYFTHRSFAGDLVWIVRGVFAVIGVAPAMERDLLTSDRMRGLSPRELDGVEP